MEQISMFSIVKNYNNKPTPKPKNLKLRTKELWCPYCSNIVIFIKDKELGVKRCPICKVSNRDYHVKINNNSFGF